jgi:diaminohydroxyphosphoribosylaminopyrimidine deaminase/5-amino-6-(5-phosphoribosylamino)uracil reductase
VPNIAITGAAARDFTHRQRATSDAILVGGATANIDDPRLSVRIPDLADRIPLRVVLAGREPLRPDLILFDRQSRQPTVVIGAHGTTVPAGIPFWPVAGAPRPELAAALERLGEAGIGRLLVEGGAALTAALLGEGRVDRFLLLASPVVVGADGLPASQGSLAAELAAAGLVEVDRRALGDDMLAVFEKR